jgi:uncharacterized protein YecT (DUF1311 family)
VRGRLPIILLPVVLAAGSAVAAPCDTAQTTVEINQCFDRQFARADAQLNETYRAALARIAETSELEEKVRREWRNALQDAQRKWIAFRDADCKGPVAYAWYGGTGATAAVLACMIEKTATRTNELKRYGEK